MTIKLTLIISSEKHTTSGELSSRKFTNRLPSSKLNTVQLLSPTYVQSKVTKVFLEMAQG